MAINSRAYSFQHGGPSPYILCRNAVFNRFVWEAYQQAEPTLSRDGALLIWKWPREKMVERAGFEPA